MMKNNALLSLEQHAIDCDFMQDFAEDHFDEILKLVSSQQKTSIELTKLVLEHGNFSNLDEKKIHKIFINAVEVVAKTFDKSLSK